MKSSKTHYSCDEIQEGTLLLWQSPARHTTLVMKSNKAHYSCEEVQQSTLLLWRNPARRTTLVVESSKVRYTLVMKSRKVHYSHVLFTWVRLSAELPNWSSARTLCVIKQLDKLCTCCRSLLVTVLWGVLSTCVWIALEDLTWERVYITRRVTAMEDLTWERVFIMRRVTALEDLAGERVYIMRRVLTYAFTYDKGWVISTEFDYLEMTLFKIQLLPPSPPPPPTHTHLFEFQLLCSLLCLWVHCSYGSLSFKGPDAQSIFAVRLWLCCVETASKDSAWNADGDRLQSPGSLTEPVNESFYDVGHVINFEVALQVLFCYV